MWPTPSSAPHAHARAPHSPGPRKAQAPVGNTTLKTRPKEQFPRVGFWAVFHQVTSHLPSPTAVSPASVPASIPLRVCCSPGELRTVAVPWRTLGAQRRILGVPQKTWECHAAGGLLLRGLLLGAAAGCHPPGKVTLP
ncbi:uncharacterized protein LOC144368307 [Ictidomys tridecemlineatus]